MTTMSINHLENLDFQGAEAINKLCANLSIAGGDIRKILITSCYPNEGKSFVSIHLFRAMAELGKKIILVDADVRASTLQRSYDIEVGGANEYLGLSGLLSGLCGIDDVIGHTDIPGADMILPGKTVMNSFPLFNSFRLEELLDELGKRYDLVLIDTPPIGTIIDTAKISKFCNAALFVVGKTGNLLLFQTSVNDTADDGATTRGTQVNGKEVLLIFHCFISSLFCYC